MVFSSITYMAELDFLVFDNNLSARLPEILIDTYGKMHHVREYGLHKASDEKIWDYVRQRKGTIFSKDVDFYHLLKSVFKF